MFSVTKGYRCYTCTRLHSFGSKCFRILDSDGLTVYGINILYEIRIYHILHAIVITTKNWRA